MNIQSFVLHFDESGALMIKSVRYVDKEGKDYMRVFATTAAINGTTHNSVVFDFCEEYVEPTLVIRRNFTTDETEYNQDDDELIINREKRCSVTMNKENALRLARLVIDRFENEEEDTDDDN